MYRVAKFPGWEVFRMPSAHEGAINMEVSRIMGALAHLPGPLRIRVVRWAIERFLDIYADISAEGGENLPKGPVLFVSNHLSNADALVLNRVLRRFGYRRRVVYLAGVKLADEIMTRLGMETVATIPIHPNTPDRDAIRGALKAIESGDAIFIFPEGGRSRTGALIEGKAGVVLLARKAGVPVVPIGMEGTEKLMPIKEGEMGREGLRRSQISVRIGRPFTFAELEQEVKASGPETSPGERRTADAESLLTALMLRIASLLSPNYRGVYADHVD